MQTVEDKTSQHVRKNQRTKLSKREENFSLNSAEAKRFSKPVSVDGFLSNKECSNILRELDYTLWRPSLAFERQTDGGYQDVMNTTFRVSETAFENWFGNELNLMITKIESRLQEIVAFDPSHLEPWQATSYPRNGHVDFHLDAGYWENDPSGDRVVTFLIYLTTPKKGGSTYFRAFDFDIEAMAGRLVVWNNLFPDGRPDYRMVHSGTPLIQGKKITLVTWVRQRRCRENRLTGASRNRV